MINSACQRPQSQLIEGSSIELYDFWLRSRLLGSMHHTQAKRLNAARISIYYRTYYIVLVYVHSLYSTLCDFLFNVDFN